MHCKHLIKINGAVGERCQNRSRRKKIRCLGRIVHKLLTQFLWEMMSLRANNNNNLAHGSQPRLSAWFSLSSVFVKLEQTWRSHTHTHTQKKKKKKHTRSCIEKNGSGGDLMHLRLTGARSIKRLDILRKWLRRHADKPRAAPRLQRCVYLESYSWGGRQRAAKLKQSHRVIIFSPVCCGLLFETPSLLPGNKEQQREKTNGTGAPRRAHTSISKSESAIITITLFVFFFCFLTSMQSHRGARCSLEEAMKGRGAWSDVLAQRASD